MEMMFDNEKQENLANARRKLKKFRDQQKQNGGDLTGIASSSNGNNFHLINGASANVTSSDPARSPASPKDLTSFVAEQQAILNGIHENLSKSPIGQIEERNRQYELLLESQKQQRARLEDQRLYGAGSSIVNLSTFCSKSSSSSTVRSMFQSGRSSQTQSDVDFARQIDQKYRRDLEHLQEQLEIHVQTIGVLVAEKTDLTAKLGQTSKLLERKQGELDVIQGRLKESRDRVEELERHTQNSTFHAQKREMAAKESDKELDRLRVENQRQNQLIEDLKQNLTELDQKYHQRQNLVDQQNTELTKLRQKLEQTEIRLQQLQSITDSSVTEKFDEQMSESNKIIQSKNNEIEALLAMVNQLRSENEQLQMQHQQYNSNVQRHIHDMNEQIKQLTEKNHQLISEQETTKKHYETKLIDLYNTQTENQNGIVNDLRNERDTLEQQNKLFQNAIEQWATQYEVLRTENHQLTTTLAERDGQIDQLEEEMTKLRESSTDHEKLLQSMHEDKATLSRAIAQNKTLKEQLVELQDKVIAMSNDNANLMNQIQAKEHLNKQLNERLAQSENPLQQFPTVTHEEAREATENISGEQQRFADQRLEELTKENQTLRDRLNEMEETLKKSSTTEQQTTPSVPSTSLGPNDEEVNQIKDAFVQKIIDRFNRAMRDNADLQDRTQQLEHLILQLQSETETIGDYISLYQQQREQLHRRYQEKDDYIKQLTQDRLNLQRKLAELESLLLHGLSKASNGNNTAAPQESIDETTSSQPISTNQEKLADENEWPDMIDNVLSSSSSSDPTATTTNHEKISANFAALNNFDEETKTRILNLLRELGETNSSAQADLMPTAKLAFIGKNLYVCSTCSGPVQWV